MCEKRKTNNKLYRLTVCLTCCRGSDEYNAIVLAVDCVFICHWPKRIDAINQCELEFVFISFCVIGTCALE